MYLVKYTLTDVMHEDGQVFEDSSSDESFFEFYDQVVDFYKKAQDSRSRNYGWYSKYSDLELYEVKKIPDPIL